MGLFDLNPKDSARSLFGREIELEELVRLVEAGRWVAVLGPRMVGKTSLVKAANGRMSRRSVYVNLWGASGTLGFMSAFVAGLNSNEPVLSKIRGKLRRVEGLSFGPAGVSVTAPRRPLKTIWDLLELIGAESSDCVIELDEFQEVSSASGPILKLLANIFNTHPNVCFIFTGSKFGLIRSLLDPKSTSPMFGRPPAELTLTPFDREKSMRFLEAGLKENSVVVPRGELERVVTESLDGIPGWLTLYGNQVAVQRRPSQEAELHAIEQGKKVARAELEHFLIGRSSIDYWSVLALLARGGGRWSDVQGHLSSVKGYRVNDNSVRVILDSLVRGGFLVHSRGSYAIEDPMIRKCVQARRRGKGELRPG